MSRDLKVLTDSVNADGARVVVLNNSCQDRVFAHIRKHNKIEGFVEPEDTTDDSFLDAFEDQPGIEFYWDDDEIWKSDSGEIHLIMFQYAKDGTELIPYETGKTRYIHVEFDYNANTTTFTFGEPDTANLFNIQHIAMHTSSDVVSFEY
jgi:hypothetical protein